MEPQFCQIFTSSMYVFLIRNQHPYQEGELFFLYFVLRTVTLYLQQTFASLIIAIQKTNVTSKNQKCFLLFILSYTFFRKRIVIFIDVTLKYDFEYPTFATFFPAFLAVARPSDCLLTSPAASSLRWRREKKGKPNKPV